MEPALSLSGREKSEKGSHHLENTASVGKLWDGGRICDSSLLLLCFYDRLRIVVAGARRCNGGIPSQFESKE